MLQAPPQTSQVAQGTPKAAARQDEPLDPSVVVRRHLIDHFDRDTRKCGIEVTQPGTRSYSANSMFHVQPATAPASLAKVLAAGRVQPHELAAFAHEQDGCVLASQVGVGPAVLYRAPRLVVTRYIAGQDLPAGGPIAWKPTNRALRHLRTFHLASDAASAPPIARPLRSKYTDAARSTLELALIEPARAAALDAQVERADALLRRLGESSLVIQHGDFHAGNVRVANGGSVYLIDLERWGRGEPTADLAHYAQELGLRDMRRVLRGYGGRATPHLLPRLRLSMFLIHAEHLMLWVKWNATEDWCKNASWGPAKVPTTEKRLARGLKHLERYERAFGV